MVFFFAAVASWGLLIMGGAIYFTSAACRYARSRHWRIGWHLGLVGSAAAGILTGCLICVGLSLQPGSWGKMDFRPGFFWYSLIGPAISLIPAEIVVWRHRRRPA
jgi:hypothetical protein